MNRATAYGSITALVVTATAVIPGGAARAAMPGASHLGKADNAKTYKGPIVTMRWGPVRAIISVKRKKIADVKVGVQTDTERSLFIDEQAAPILRQEVLKAQSAEIDEVSGATMTSDAFIQSLQSAIKKAHLKTSHK